MHIISNHNKLNKSGFIRFVSIAHDSFSTVYTEGQHEHGRFTPHIIGKKSIIKNKMNYTMPWLKQKE